MAIKIKSNPIGGVHFQSGSGIPNHLSPIGTVFINSDAPFGYLSKGDGSWVPVTVTLTGGTYNTNNGVISFTNSTGDTFSISGFTLPITGGTFSAGTTTFTNISGSSFNINGFNKPLSSGVYSGGVVTINADPTKINISAGGGILVDYWTQLGHAIEYPFTWPTLTGISVTYLSSSTQSYIGINQNGSIQQTPNFPSNQNRRQYIFLAQLGHANNITINSVNPFTSFYDNPIETTRDIIHEFKLINEGNVISPNGANLNINKSAGYLFGMGINYGNNVYDSNKKFLPSQIPISFRYRTQTGGTTSTVTNIDGTVYDNGGIITPIAGSNNQATNQRVYLFPNGNVVIQYGQQVYSTMTNAIAGLQTEIFNKFNNVDDGAILIGIIVVIKGAVNLSSVTDARFIPVSKIGENLGGAAGISTTTLQGAYNNSTTPEITTNSILNAITLKDGVGSGNVIEVMNTANTINASINGRGDLTANTITTPKSNQSNVTTGYTINMSDSNIIVFSATSNCRLSYSGAVVGQYGVIIDNSGAYTLTLNTSNGWYSNLGVQPTLSGLTYLTTLYDGNRMFIKEITNMQQI